MRQTCTHKAVKKNPPNLPLTITIKTDSLAWHHEHTNTLTRFQRECEVICVCVRVWVKESDLDERQSARMGGEKEKGRAICTSPPTALPALWCEGQSVTNLLALAGLPFLSRCTCFTTLNTSHVPRGPSSTLFFALKHSPGKKKRRRRSQCTHSPMHKRTCVNTHTDTHTQT